MKIIIFTKRVITIVTIMYGILFAQNTPPVVTNVDFNIRNDGSKIVDITYDVNDIDEQTMTVTIAASSDSGATWNLPITQVTGAVGSGITNGTGKTIVWNAGAEIPNFYSGTVQIRITADDGIFSCGSQITYSGKVYSTIQIGNQCWFRENLDVGSFVLSVGGSMIHSDVSNNGVIEKYCYNNDTSHCNIFGGLYDWNEAMQYSTTPGAKGICPDGWHIPTKIEQEELGSAVGNSSNVLKDIGQGTGSGSGTNASGFSALLAGYRNPYGNFQFFNISYYSWSSTAADPSAYFLFLKNYDNNIGYNYIGNKSSGVSVRCLKDVLPKVSTSDVSAIGSSTARVGGEVISLGSSPVSERGICWSTSEFPTISDSKTSAGFGLGSFISSIIDITDNTTYFVRAYATSSLGTSYGSQVSFTTLSSVTYAGKTYNTIQIGNQYWLTENLDVGTMIQGNENASNNGIIEKYCYDNSTENCSTYGGLYQWAEVVQYLNGATNSALSNPQFFGNIRGICPEGWQIPTIADLQLLKYEVGGDGNALKAIGQGSGNGAGTNGSNFSALLGGARHPAGYFVGMDNANKIWSTGNNPTWANYMYQTGNDGTIDFRNDSKSYGHSVRCTKILNPVIKITSPKGEESWIAGTFKPINWASSGVTNVNIEYSMDNGNSWNSVVEIQQASSGIFMWSIPHTPTTNAKLRITDALNLNIGDTIDQSFTILSNFDRCPSSVTYSGKTYNTVLIENQCWLRENLDVGTMIQGSQNATNNGVIEKYCYDNNPANCETYGGLYQWNEAMQYVTTQGTKGICPPGWHLPISSEFQDLAQSVVIGGRLLAVGQNSGQGAGTNTSGFSALMSGSRHSNGGFSSLNVYSDFWSSSANNDIYSYRMGLQLESGGIYLGIRENSIGYSIRCLKDTIFVPTVNTSAVSTVGSNSATVGGEVISIGSSPVNERGVCWSTSENPTITDSKTSDGSGLGSFTSSIAGLTANTTYFVRAYATSSVGTGYGNQVTFRTTHLSCPGLLSVTYNGKTYNTVQVGLQCWLKENLNIGTMIGVSQNPSNNGIIEKYCYMNNETNCSIYGGLYQWSEAMEYNNTPGSRGICPEGWHIPTLAEYQELSTAVNNDAITLKEVGIGSGLGIGTNLSGFTALLEGGRQGFPAGHFYNFNIESNYWSSSAAPYNQVNILSLWYSTNTINITERDKDVGYSVRCTKD